MKLTKSINVQGTIVPAGTELHFSNEGIGYYNGIEVQRDMFPEVAIEAKRVKTYIRKGYSALLGIYAYDSKVKAICGLRTAPKPWLHAAVIHDNGSSNVFVALYIWDTRLIVACEHVKMSDSDRAKLSDISQAIDTRRSIKMPKNDDDYFSNYVVKLTNALLSMNKRKTLSDIASTEDKQA
jgi:hypothetical protein